MGEESLFFHPIKDFCRREVVTCSPDDRVMDAAAVMREKNISSVVVLCEEGTPAGIITDRDLRNKIVSGGQDPRSVAVRAIMNSPLITVNENDFLFEALYRMSRHNIHRVGVVDSDGRLMGIMTDSDILRLQTRSPQQMVRDIEESDSIEELKAIHARVQGLVVHLVGTGVPTRDLVRMIAHLNDQILLRLIAILREGAYKDLPPRFAFVVLGSEGRREQTLTTDQDNAIIHADDLSAAEMCRIESFSRELIDSLITIGVPACPGGIMAKNEAWRRSLSGWFEVLDGWLSNPTSENIMTGSMFFDIRTLYGDSSLERELKEQVAEGLRRNTVFLARTAANVVRFRPPLGWFGRFRVERKGENRGLLDIKKAGIFAITEGVKVLALEAGIFNGGTRERMQLLTEANVLGREQAEDLEASFNFLVFLRLRAQVAAIRAGREPSNHLALEQLNRMEKGRLRLALEGVGSFQDFLGRHFRLDQLR